MQTENFYVRCRKKFWVPWGMPTLDHCIPNSAALPLSHMQRLVVSWITCRFIRDTYLAYCYDQHGGKYHVYKQNKKHSKIYLIDQWTMTWIHPRWKSCQQLVKQAHATPNICAKRVFITPTHLMTWNKETCQFVKNRQESSHNSN